MASEIPVTGTVLAENGEPLLDARVSLESVAGRYSEGRSILLGESVPEVAAALVRKDGSFHLLAPAEGMWKVVAQAPGRIAFEVQLLPLLEAEDLPAVRLPAEHPVRLAVRDSKGNPLPGAHVMATVERSKRDAATAWLPAAQRGKTDQHGELVLRHMGRQRLRLEVSAPGRLSAVTSSTFPRGRLTLRLDEGRPQEIVVRNQSGNPVAEALVWQQETSLPLGQSDDDGHMVLALPPASSSTFDVLTKGGGFARMTLRAPPVGEEERTAVVIDPAPVLRGRVLSALRREPLADALVWMTADPAGFVRTAGDGAWVLTKRDGPGEGWVKAAAARHFSASAHLLAGQLESERGPALVLLPEARVAGMVVDGDGEPISGVQVRAFHHPGERRLPGFLLKRSGGLTRSSASGRFEVRSLLTEIPYDLLFSKEGFAPVTVELLGQAPEDPALDLHVVLRRGRLARGRVFDLESRPVEGASVSLRPVTTDYQLQMAQASEPERLPTFKTSSDADGRFELADLPAGDFVLDVRARGFAPFKVPGVSVTEDALEVDLGTVVLEPGVKLEGRVTDPAEQPIEGAEVRLLEGDPMAQFLGDLGAGRSVDAVSSPDGWFEIADLRPGERMELDVRHPDYVTAEVAAFEVPLAEPLEVQLRPRARVEGRVTGSHGGPIAGAWVELDVAVTDDFFGGESVTWGASVRQTRSDGEGRFSFQGVDPGEARLTIRAAGWQTGVFEGLSFLPGEARPLEVVLEPGADVEGRVFTPEGMPVWGARVRVATMGSLGFPVFSATDGEGYYRLEGLRLGRQSVVVEHRNFQSQAREVDLQPGVNVLDVVLKDGATVRGRVVDPAGAPVQGARVSLRSDELRWDFPRTLTGADGSFTFRGLGEGVYRLTADKPPLAAPRESLRVEVGSEPVEGLEVWLEAGISVLGRILGLEPAELAQLYVSAGPPPRTGVVKFDGTYRVDALSPGRATIRGTVGASGREVEGQVDLEPGETEVVFDLDFTQGLICTGQALLNGEQLTGVSILLRGIDLPAESWRQTDQKGEFRFQGLGAGTYELLLTQASTGLRYRRTVEIHEDRHLVLDVEAGPVRGRVSDGGTGLPLAGADVHLEAASAEAVLTRTTRTDSQGGFSFEAVAVGKWKVRAASEGFAAAEAAFTVASAAGVEGLELDLYPTEGVVLQQRIKEIHLLVRYLPNVRSLSLDG